MPTRLATPSKTRRARLSVEPLEGREVPANFIAATVGELVAALNAANANHEADTITLAAGRTFTLTAADNTTDGPTGLPVVMAAEPVAIVGAGATVERATADGTPAFRLFDVAPGAALTLANLTLQGGLAAGAIGQSNLAGSGGAVLNRGTLTLSGLTVRNNTARGLAAGWTQGFGLSPWAATAGLGGAVYSSGVLSVANSTVGGNTALGGHGAAGIYYFNDQPGSGSGPRPGTAGGDGLGGALYVAGGSAAVTNSAFTGNTARGGDGGNGYASGTTAGGDGGDGLGGGLYAAAGTVTVRGTTVTANLAAGGTGGTGTGKKPDGARGLGIGGGMYLDATALVGLDVFTARNTKSNSATGNHRDIRGAYDSIS
jgi:hypothetical protein